MLGGLIAANSSTILTHLNWGASYLVHDFYRRFIKPDAPDKHYVAAGRVATVILFVASSAMVFALDTAKDSFDVILQIGAGTGLLYLVRWFWWRVTAWCEIVAMISSFGISILFLILKKTHMAPGTYQEILAAIGGATVLWVFTRRSATMRLKIFSSTGFALLIGIVAKMGPAPGPASVMLVTIEWTTVLWVLTAYLGPQTSEAALLNFYRKVRPPGPGWRHIQAIAGIPAAEAAADRAAWNFPMSLLGWFSGCITIWSALFTVGNFLYGRMDYFWAMLAVFVVSGSILVRVVNRLWR
jgi:hypothetical protein